MGKKADPKAVQIKVLRTSKGRQVKAGDTVAVLYSGSLVDGGRQFDSNYNFSTFQPVEGREPFTFVIGSGQVIEGWDQGFPGLRIGQIARLTIPSDLAYGPSGSAPVIPANAALVFDVELIGVLPKNAEGAIYPTFRDLGLSQNFSQQAIAFAKTAQSTKIGTDAADQLIGGEQRDLLIGLLGNDVLSGGGDADFLIGGIGKNRFIYTSLSDSPARDGSRDTVLGFNAKAGDRFDFTAFGGNLSFIGGKPFSGAPGEVQFQAGSVKLDADGDQNADLAVELPGVSRLNVTALLL